MQQGESVIVDRVNELKNAGLFDAIYEQSSILSSRSITETSEVTPSSEFNVQDAIYFVENPTAVISELNASDTSNQNVELIEALLNNSSVGEIANIMEKISPEMAEEYLSTVETQINQINVSISQEELSSTEIRAIHLAYSTDKVSSSRGIWASNLNDDTIYWYYGMCATTIAGLSAYKWCKWWAPWVGVAGIATAVAGGASMATQLGIWYSCTDFKSWINAFVNKNSAQATTQLNSSIGPKLLGISVATGGVVGFCLVFTPEVSTFIVSKSIMAWNKFISIIYSVLPDGVVLIINGVKLVAL